MIGMESNHCRILSDSLTGARQVDEHTYTALDELFERLEKVKRLEGAFAGISFSPEVEALQKSARVAAVG